jgi:hypothetical protein
MGLFFAGSGSAAAVTPLHVAAWSLFFRAFIEEIEKVKRAARTKMYCRESRGLLQPEACGKKEHISISAASTLSLPCTRSTCLRGEVGQRVCVAAVRPSSCVHK